MADIVYTNSEEVTADSARKPWNNLIFPGNYVSGLNSYRQQGVLALPGISFFQQIGAYVVPDTATSVATGNYAVKILSPDKRQDDKPRLDRDFVVPGADVGGSGCGVYRVAISTVNLKGTGSSTITTNGAAIGDITLGNLVDGATGLFPEGGKVSAFDMLGNAATTKITSNTTVGVTVAGAALSKIDSSKEAAILLEVCFYADDGAPTADDLNLPYPVESGQSSQ